jgi:hydrogen cyanide synthase HcnB
MKNDTLKEKKADVVIVGAGPAGINAACCLAKHGVMSVVIDESSKIGGAIYRGSLRANSVAGYLDKKLKHKMKQFQKLFDQNSKYIEYLKETQVVGFTNNLQHIAMFNEEKGLFTLKYKKLIICTGCYERTIPFPGWTLPGVMTLGGLQLQVKNGQVKPDASVVLVGTGPLLLVAAKQLHLAGVRVLGVYESGTKSQLAKQYRLMIKNMPQVIEGLKYLCFLKKAQIDVHYGWGLVEAIGKEGLNEVVVAPYNSFNQPILEKSTTIHVGTLGVGFGFVSRSRLASLLGVRMERTENNGPFPKVDKWCRTSLPDVYAAGDVADVYGANVAEAEGKVAALAILTEKGLVSEYQAHIMVRPMWKEIEKHKTFRSAFSEFSSVNNGLLQLPKEDTVICACENVTRKNIDDVIARGIQDITTLKMVSRITMGDCQGNRCGEFCRDYLRNKLQKDNVGELQAQFPLSLLSFDAVMKGGVHENIL